MPRIYRVFVRRVRCKRCGIGDALSPDFVLRGRRDSAAAVGAAVLPPLGSCPGEAATLYQGVPGRTVRSWRKRFAERAGELAEHFEALSAARGSVPAFGEAKAWPPPRRAVEAICSFWRAAHCCHGDVPPAWALANVVVGSALLSTRVVLPSPASGRVTARSRAP